MVVAQSAAAIWALIMLAMWPPAHGKMMLVPISGADVDVVAKIAIAGGASLIGVGPFPGSLVVDGDRLAVSRHNPSLAVIIMAAPPAGCGPIDPAGATT